MTVQLEAGVAYISADRLYRYALSRIWDNTRPRMLFVGLNPSTADEARLDPTLRRVVRFAMREGCGGLWVGNLCAFRATKPATMREAVEAGVDPVGPENDRWLADMARWCAPNILVGWGANGIFLDRDAAVKRLLRNYDLKCLGRTKNGQPRHPLYIAAKTELESYTDDEISAESGMKSAGVSA